MFDLSRHCLADNFLVKLRLTVSVVLLFSASHSFSDSAKTWFLAQYVPLWQDVHSLKAEALAQHYHHTGFMQVDGELVQWLLPDSIDYLMAEIKTSGWQSAKVLRLSESLIDSNSQALTVVWQSEYQENKQLLSCEWYLLEDVKGQWKIVQHRYINCL